MFNSEASEPAVPLTFAKRTSGKLAVYRGSFLNGRIPGRAKGTKFECQRARLLCLVALSAALVLDLPVKTAAANLEPPPISSARDLHQLSRSSATELRRVQLDGVVLGYDAVHNCFAFRDGSGCVWMSADRLPAGFAPGLRISISGKAMVGKGAVALGLRPLIETEYTSRASIGQGRIFLPAGHHRFEIDYTQEDGPQLLSITMAGQNFANRVLGGPLLLRRDSASGSFVTGVEYSCFESAGPGLPATNLIGRGATSSLDLGIAGRTNFFRLRFTGAIHVTQAGHYDFEMRADDSARFAFDYDPEVSITVHGSEPLPRPAKLMPGQSWPALDEPAWVEVEGIVKRAGVHHGMMHLEISGEAGRMEVMISGAKPLTAPLLMNSRVRLTGLAQATMPPGSGKIAGSMLVPAMNNVVVLTPAETIWSSHRFTQVQALAGQKSRSIVRLQGTVDRVSPGESLVLRDDTGAVEALTPLADLTLQGTTLDLLGNYDGSNRLDFVTFRIDVRKSEPSTNPPTLTTIEQIRRLKPDEVIRAFPVKFQGVVTFVFQGGLRAHVQGEREGIYVASMNKNPQPLTVGDLCEFEGSSSRGAFSPVVTYRTRNILGRGHTPEPLHPEWSQLANGSLDAQWVEVEGVVVSVTGRELLLALRGGELMARVFEGDADALKELTDSIVRVRGTLRGFANAQRQSQRVLLQVISPANITVQDAAPSDPFEVPLRTLAELYEFDPNATVMQRVRTRGQVVHVRDNVGHLLDGTNAVRFIARSPQPVTAGDLVELVGFPEMDSHSLSIHQALLRVTGKARLPQAQAISESELLDRQHESTLVEVEATLLNVRTNQTDCVLELQIGRHNFLARLPVKSALPGAAPSGSRVRVTGLFTSAQSSPSRTNKLRAFELLLNSPGDVIVLKTPSWWNLRRTLTVLGLMTLVLLLSVIWIGALRRRVELRTRELREEIESRKKTERNLELKTQDLQREVQERTQIQRELEEKKGRLETEIEERRRIEIEVEKIHRELMHASRQAGQAEVASSVLHNVGNVLNSVNVSATLVSEGLQNLTSTNLDKAADLLRNRCALLTSLPKDDPVQRLPEYLERLALRLEGKRTALLGEIKELSQNVGHIKEIVAMQQNYARVAGVTERVAPAELVESAFKINASSYERHGVQLVREFQSVPELTLDRHKVLQILVNLFQNAKAACEAEPGANKTVVARIAGDTNRNVVIEVSDNGVGISPEHMKRLFSHGFTTRKDGHGFGLHSAALAAKELGGSLTASSPGPGRGATFTLRIPVQFQTAA